MKQRVTIVLLHAPFDLYGQLQYLILKLYLFIIDKKCLVLNPCSFEDSCFYTFKVICQPLWYQADTSSSIKYQVEPSFTSCTNVEYQVFYLNSGEVQFEYLVLLLCLLHVQMSSIKYFI